MHRTTIQRDPDATSMTIERRFDAERPRVWRAFTEPELLDQWWAPEPYETETLTMDFRPGGRWHYAMNGPDGARHYGRIDYESIEKDKHFSGTDVFADESGEPLPGMPRQEISTTFRDEGEETLVIAVVDYASLEDLQKVIDMGIEDGVKRAQDQLDSLLRDGFDRHPHPGPSPRGGAQGAGGD